MKREEEPCRGINGEKCTSHYIQNKRYHLCSNCVYKKKHGGKSKQQVAIEKQKEKRVNLQSNKAVGSLLKELLTPIDTESINKWDAQEAIFLANRKAQDNITETEDAGEKKFRESLEKKKTKYKGVRKISSNQAEINRLYILTCKDIDYIREKVCSGCLRYQGGNVKLSHSHLISRQDAKRIGKPELIYETQNIVYHCMDFAGNVGCHKKWENPTLRDSLKDYEENMKVIKKLAPELYQKYVVQK
jgi:hypothetical protein